VYKSGKESSFVHCGALSGKSAQCSDARDCGLAPAYGLRCFFLFVLNFARLGADFLDVAFLMNSLSVLVSLATFKRHGLVADRAFRAFDVRLAEDAIEGRHRTNLFIAVGQRYAVTQGVASAKACQKYATYFVTKRKLVIRLAGSMCEFTKSIFLDPLLLWIDKLKLPEHVGNLTDFDWLRN
jgi:hypothetical protein